jgi:putative membrane protein
MLLLRSMAVAAGGLVIALAAGSVRPLQAQAKPGDVKADSKFIHEISSDNLMDIRLGQIAENKASNSEVKDFGKRMVTDHTKLEDDWTSMAAKNGLKFTPGLGRRHKAKVDQLEKLSGKEFDRAYMTSMVRNHQEDVDYLQNESKSARSAPVRDLVGSILPTFEQHLTLAKQVGSKVGADTTATSRHITARK